MSMGTASTMACMVEALGLTLPGAAAIPAVDARKKVMAQLGGKKNCRNGKRRFEAFKNSYPKSI